MTARRIKVNIEVETGGSTRSVAFELRPFADEARNFAMLVELSPHNLYNVLNALASELAVPGLYAKWLGK